MPEPNNYILDIKQPDMLAGLAKGMALTDALKARQDAEAQRQAQLQMQQDLHGVATNPTVEGINRIMLQYPAVADKFKPALESATAQQKDSRIGQASDVYASLLAGRKDIAKRLLDEQATAAKNSGDDKGAQHASIMSQLLDTEAGIKTVMGSAGMFLSSAMGPEKFAETYSKLEGTARSNEIAPAEQAKATAEATTAGAKAKFAEPQAIADLEKAGWDIKKIQGDIEIGKQNSRIAAMNAALARETNDLKRQNLGLKLQDAQAKRDETMRGKVAEAESAMSIVTDAQAVLADILSDKDSLLAAIGGGSIRGSIPGSKAKSAAVKIDRLENIFASGNLDKLKGAMSDKDIVFLKNIGTSLNRSQNEATFMKELDRIGRVLEDNRGRVARKYGMPSGAPSGVSTGEPQKTITVDF